MKQNTQAIIIRTPEHFELQFRLAGIGTRFLAFFIDSMIQAGAILGVIFIITMVLFLGLGSRVVGEWLTALTSRLSQWMIALVILAEAAIRIGYFMVFEHFWNGATPGKRALRIRVVRKDGRSLTFMDTALRNILRFVDVIGGVYPLGLIVMFIDPYNRRLGDLTAGTVVVEDRPVKQPSLAKPPEGLRMHDPEILSAVRQMKPDDYRLLTKFLGRRAGLELRHREELVGEIYRRIYAKAADPRKSALEIEDDLVTAEALYREITRIL